MPRPTNWMSAAFIFYDILETNQTKVPAQNNACVLPVREACAPSKVRTSYGYTPQLVVEHVCGIALRVWGVELVLVA